MIGRPKTPFIAVGLLVISLNVLIVLILLPKTSRVMSGLYNESTFADGYDQIAANLAAGNGYRFFPDTARTLMREPGYPTLLAGVYTAFGNNFITVELTNILLALGTAFLIICLARNVSSSPFVIFAPPVIFLLHPATLVAETRGGVEIVFAFMLTLYMLTLYRVLQTNRCRDYLLSGGVLGLTVLVRGTPLLFPCALLPYLVFLGWREKNSKPSILRNVATMTLAMLAVMSPWIIRNYMLTKKFVPTASVLGIAADSGLYLSTHQAIGNALLDTEAFRERNQLARDLGYRFKEGYYQYFYSSSDELEFSNFLFRRAVSQYESRPRLFVKSLGVNLLKFWCGGKTWMSMVLGGLLQFPILALAIFGFVTSAKGGRLKEVAPLGLVICYIVAVSMPILSQARYSQPLIPFLAILACIAILKMQATIRPNETVGRRESVTELVS
jgi:4-amino-4-deoxy-L-arabinose transferase-like glycosyltransferase